VILLDTSVLSRAFRRATPGPSEQRVRVALEALMVGQAALGLPGIVLQEVLSGIRNPRQFADLERRLLDGFEIVHATTHDHIAAAKLRNACLTRGLNVSGTDCLIAHLAVAGGHRLLASDEDFQAIARHSKLQLLGIDDLA
jgi:predicted nucleic acid-binding protein